MIEDLKVLRKRLSTWLACGYIEYDSYTVGMQVLQRMAAGKSMTITTSWQDMAMGVVVHKGEAIAPVAPPTAHRFYRALQELHRTVGLLSHVTLSGLAEAREEARLSPLQESYHITSLADTPSDIIGARTPLVFEFVAHAGPDLAASVDGYLEQGKNIELPKWLV